MKFQTTTLVPLRGATFRQPELQQTSCNGTSGGSNHQGLPTKSSKTKPDCPTVDGRNPAPPGMVKTL